jgi:hypothetical protein
VLTPASLSQELQTLIDRVPEAKAPSLELHLNIDFAQNVKVPHEQQQTGQYFFTTPLKVSLFGVRETFGESAIYLIPEGHHPGTHPKTFTGVISMLWEYLRLLCKRVPILRITADNCSRENKNLFVMAFFQWLVCTGFCREVTVHFMITGHTKTALDASFGCAKSVYWHENVYTLELLDHAVNNSSQQSTFVMKMPAQSWRDFRVFADHVRPVQGIHGQHHLRFTSESKGHVFMKELVNSEETDFWQLKGCADNPDAVQKFSELAQPATVPCSGLSPLRITYLWDKVIGCFTPPEVHRWWREWLQANVESGAQCPELRDFPQPAGPAAAQASEPMSP